MNERDITLNGQWQRKEGFNGAEEWMKTWHWAEVIFGCG
jgi:hypothetical protein